MGNQISEIDKNFVVETNINKTDIKFYSAKNEPFRIYGVFYEDGKWRRIPEAVAKTVSEGVYSLHAHTAGGRVRFKTDSPYIAISAKMPAMGRMSHFALCGSAGFGIYCDGVYSGSYPPPFFENGGFEGIRELGGAKMRDIVIDFPLYSEVSELYIGVSADAEVLPGNKYKIERPIVFYGSSITQGGCASRPGTAYQGFISRALDVDYINLGFSGNAKAEREISEYIKSLDMSAFVYDYDHNAPSNEHLAETHERMFLEIREAHPTLPIIIMPRPKCIVEPFVLDRRKIIRRTYENAVARGDKNVYYIDGCELMALGGDEGTVDTTHPTDLGFFSMAQALIPVLSKIGLK